MSFYLICHFFLPLFSYPVFGFHNFQILQIHVVICVRHDSQYVLLNLLIFNVLFKDGNKITNLFFFFQTKDAFDYWFNLMDEQLHQLSQDAVVVFHEVGKDYEQ